MTPPSLISIFLLFIFLNWIGHAQIDIPAKPDGFVYKKWPSSINTVMIEAFLDPVCPDSRDSWQPLKRALEYYGPRVSLIVHPFALPYHDNAFVTSRALHVVDKLNTSVTYDLVELFFEHQEEFYNRATYNISRSEIVSQIVNLATNVIGNFYRSAVNAGFTDRTTDITTRVSFKYGCSRGVSGTPFFFVNGFVLPGAGSALPYNKWRAIIDPLLKAQGRSPNMED